MSIISAGTSVGTSLVSTGDTTGNLVFKTGSSNTTALTLSGTDQSATFAGAVSFSSNAFALGSASAPSITFTGDTNTGIFSPGADTIAFTEGGAESMRIDASGNLGLGTTSPQAYSGYTVLTVDNATNGGVLSIRKNGTVFGNLATGTSTFTIDAVGVGNTLSLQTNGSTRVLVGSSGQIGIGGANYGTSGQVLTSAGSGAAPSWQTVSGGVTSLNGQSGAITNTDLYAIGSYITGRPQNNTTYAINSTVAGSSLYNTITSGFWNGNESNWGNVRAGTNGIAGQTLVNTGTWRCMSTALTAQSDTSYSGLWVRIS